MKIPKMSRDKKIFSKTKKRPLMFKLPSIKLPKFSKSSKNKILSTSVNEVKVNLPLMKRIKNIKIVRGISLVIIFSIIAMLAIGFTSLSKLNKIGTNSKKIYSENLLPIITLGDLRSNIYIMNDDIIKMVYDGYKLETETDVNGCDSRIRNLITQYKSQVKTLDKNEQDTFTRFENDYSSYMNAWNLSSGKIKSNQKLSAEEIKSFSSISSNLTTGIDGLISYKKSISETLQKDNVKVDSSSLSALIIILVVSIAVLFLISIFLILIVKSSMKDIIKVLETVSEGDLTVEIDTSGTNEFGIMKKELDITVKKIYSMINLIKESSLSLGDQSEALAAVSEEMTASAQEIVGSIDEVAKGSNAQAEDLSNINGTVDDFGDKLDIISESVQGINNKANEIDERASQSNSSLLLLVSSIQEMGTSFNEVVKKISVLGQNISQISDITNLIKSIANQTNLLALNAAIEAARAGDAGRGFAVVADEIRKLAEQSKNSSAKINDLLSSILVEAKVAISTSNDVNNELNGKVEVIQGSIESFKGINKSITDIIPNIRKTSELLANIMKEKNNIISMVETASAVAEETSATSQNIAQSTQQMSASSEEVASTAQLLNDTTKKMIDGVNTFKL